MRYFVANYKKTDKITSASDRIARFISHVLDIPIIDDAKSATDAAVEPIDVMLVVNGPLTFLSYPAELDYAISRTKHLIWVQNDYDISIPAKPGSKAEFYVRKQFATREKLVTHWTTIPDNAVLSEGAYINWNQLTYSPPEVLIPYSQRANRVFYHGSLRKGRIDYFKKFFANSAYPLTFSTPLRSPRLKEFKALVGESQNIEIIGKLDSIAGIGNYTAALYMEDKKSHSLYCSPANRLYEYLSHSTAILVDEACRGTFERAGLIGDYFYVKNQQDIVRLLPYAKDIARQQYSDWTRDYVRELIETVKNAWKSYLETIK